MVPWRIFYGDGSEYDDAANPWAAPALDVQVIRIRAPNPGMTFGQPFYWYDMGLWYGGDHFGLWDYLQRLGPKKVIFGRTVPNEVFQRCKDRATRDPDFR